MTVTFLKYRDQGQHLVSFCFCVSSVGPDLCVAPQTPVLCLLAFPPFTPVAASSCPMTGDISYTRTASSPGQTEVQTSRPQPCRTAFLTPGNGSPSFELLRPGILEAA